MISILVHGPDFACSENLTRVFDAWGDVQLISLNDTDWREYDPGTIITDENKLALRQSVEESDLVILGDATSFKALIAIAPDNWQAWAGALPHGERDRTRRRTVYKCIISPIYTAAISHGRHTSASNGPKKLLHSGWR